MTKQNYVYFMRCGPYVKIGQSVRPDTRIADLRLLIPFEVGPIWIMPDVLGDLELELHRRFVRHRHRGEWFHWCADIEGFIQNNAGKDHDEQVVLVEIKPPETHLQRAIREERMKLRGFDRAAIVSSRMLFRKQFAPALSPNSKLNSGRRRSST